MIVLRCEKCRAKVQVPSPGQYRCHNCGNIIDIPGSISESSPSAGKSDAQYAPTQQLTDIKAETDKSAHVDDKFQSRNIGAKCINHPVRAAETSCTSCGNLLCSDCAIRVINRYYCRKCADKATQAQSAPESGDETQKEYSIPLENHAELGLLKSFFLTIKEIYTKFGNIFEETTQDSKLWIAFLFAFVFLFFNKAVDFLYQNYIMTDAFEIPESIPPMLQDALKEYLSPSITSLLYAPLAIPLYLILLSLIYHMGVVIVKGSGRFSGTFKIVCYATGANLIHILLYPLPLLPALLSLMMEIIIVLQGVQKFHKVSEGKAIFVALFPIMVIVFVIVLMVIIFFGNMT